MDRNLIANPQEARVVLFERIGHYINQANATNNHDKKASIIWAVNDMVPYVNKESDINVSSLQFSCKLGGHTFCYSIAVNIGEIRIGILIPDSMQKSISSVNLENLDLYNYESEYSPKKILRMLPNGMLLDHIFNIRFGSVDVTFKAMCAVEKNDKALDVLADAIAKELIHINHGLMHSFTEKGYLVMNTGIYGDDEMLTERVFYNGSTVELMKILNIQPVQILPFDESSYIIVYPKTDEALASKIAKINQDKNEH